MSSAEQSVPPLCLTALNLCCTVFTVDYRLAPEHKCPTGQADFAAAVRHISANAADLGIDPNKICVAGDGWICLGAMNLMATRGEHSLVRAMFLHSGNLSNEIQNMQLHEMEEYEQYRDSLTSIYKLLSTNFEL